jgi:hypothetical protein
VVSKWCRFSYLYPGDNSELYSPFNSVVKKIKFTIIYNENNRGNTIILTTGHVTDNKYYETDITSNISTIYPSYTYELDVNLRIHTNYQVLVGYTTGP